MARGIGRPDKNSLSLSDLGLGAHENTLNKRLWMRGFGEGRRHVHEMGF